MMRGTLMIAYFLGYVVFLVMASAVLEDVSLADSTIAFLRSPMMVFAPGLEGRTASQLLAAYIATAIVAALTFVIERFVRTVDRGGFGAEKVASTAIVFCRSLLTALVAFAFGVTALATVDCWTVFEMSGFKKNTDVIFPIALTMMAIFFGIRFWQLTSSRTMGLSRSLAMNMVFMTMLKLNALLLILGFILIVLAQLVSVAGGVLLYVLLIGVPTLLLSYILMEGLIFKVRRVRTQGSGR